MDFGVDCQNLTMPITVRTCNRWTGVKLINQHGSLLETEKLEQLYTAAPGLLKIALSSSYTSVPLDQT